MRLQAGSAKNDFLGRREAHARRAKAVLTDLLDSLGATTSYANHPPRRRVKVPWRTLYGWELAFRAKRGSLLDAEGKPTQIELVQKWTHVPGDIVESGQRRRTGEAPRRYMVQPDRSLRVI